MHSHSTPEPATTSRSWLPLLLIVATLLLSGLLCSSAIERLDPAPNEAETGQHPDVALVLDPAPRPDDPVREAVVVDPPVADSAGTAPVDAAPEVAADDAATGVELVDSDSRSNGNTNPNANPNGHTNNAQTGNGQAGNGQQAGRP